MEIAEHKIIATAKKIFSITGFSISTKQCVCVSRPDHNTPACLEDCFTICKAGADIYCTSTHDTLTFLSTSYCREKEEVQLTTH